MDGLLGVAGMIITSDYGSFPHSLRLAPVRGVLHKSSQLWCCSCWKTRNQRATQSPWLAWPMKLAPRRKGGVCVYIQWMPAKQTSAWHINITFPDFADCFFSRKLPRWMAPNGEKHHYSESIIYWSVVSNIFYFSIIYGIIVPTD